MFDFVFYQLNLFYEKREKGSDTVWTAVFYVTILQFLMLYSAFVFIDIFTNKTLSDILLGGNKTLAIIISLVAVVSLFLFNRNRYHRKHDLIVSKYEKHPPNRWFKIWMVAALMMLLLLSPILWNELHKLIVR